MFTNTRSLGKKDEVCISLMHGDNKLCIQHLKSGKDGTSGVMFVNIFSLEAHRYDITKFNDRPNGTIKAKKFAEVCTQAVTTKCSTISLLCKKNGITINGNTPNGTICFTTTLNFATQIIMENRGDSSSLDRLLASIPSTQSVAQPSTQLSVSMSATPQPRLVISDAITNIKIPSLLVKSLGKLHNVTNVDNNICLYYLPGVPSIKLTLPYGNGGGIYTMYIRDQPNISI
jgi:hypothetical protein